MAENNTKITAKKKLKKKLFRLGLSMAKPLLWLGTLLLLADVGALTGLLYCYDQGGIAVILWASLFSALTTAILLLIAGVIYQIYSLKAKAALRLLEDMKDLLSKTEQTLHHHLQERREKDFRRNVSLALENMQADTETQKKILQQLQADNTSSDNTTPESSPKEQISRLEKVSNFLNQSVDTFVYLQQIYHQLQELGISPKGHNSQEETASTDKEEDALLQEILTEVNSLKERLEEIHTTK